MQSHYRKIPCSTMIFFILDSSQSLSLALAQKACVSADLATAL